MNSVESFLRRLVVTIDDFAEGNDCLINLRGIIGSVCGRMREL